MKILEYYIYDYMQWSHNEFRQEELKIDLLKRFQVLLINHPDDESKNIFFYTLFKSDNF